MIVSTRYSEMPSDPPRCASPPAELLLPPERNQDALDECTGRNLRANLAHSGYLPLRNLRVDVRNGQVSLSGCVSNYYFRQLAIAAALRHVEPALLIDNIQVTTASGSVPSGMEAARAAVRPPDK